MWSLLLSLSLLTPLPTVYWQFDGPLSFEAQQLVRSEYGESLKGHLFDEVALEEHLLKVTAQGQQSASLKPASTSDLSGCLDLLDGGDGASGAQGDKEAATSPKINRATCPLSTLILRTGGINQLIYLHVQFQEGTFSAQMAVEESTGTLKTYRRTGDKLRPLIRTLLNSVFRLAHYRITSLPPKAKVWIDGQEVSSAGRYLLTEGSHDVKISAPQRQDYTTKIELKRGQILEETPKLVSALAQIQVFVLNRAELVDLEVSLDGTPLDLAQIEKGIELKPGKHTLRSSARDRQPIERVFEMQPGQTGKWDVALNYDKPLWKIAMREPHPDTLQGDVMVAVRLQTQSLNAGRWNAEVSGFKDELTEPDQLRGQPDPLSGFGFDVDVSWALSPSWGLGPARVGLVGFGYSGFTEGVVSQQATLDATALPSVNGVYQLTNLHRFSTRFLWPGYQLTAWRVSAYLKTGPMWVYEIGGIENDREDGVVGGHSFRWGWELGLDYRITPEWAIEAAIAGDVSSEERAAFQVLLGATIALDLF